MSGVVGWVLGVLIGGPIVWFASVWFAKRWQRPRSTMSVRSTAGYRRGTTLRVDMGGRGEVVIVRRVVGSQLEVAPYKGWRKWSHRVRTFCRWRYRALRDRVYGWFEKDDDDD